MSLQLSEIGSAIDYRTRPDRGERRWTVGPGNFPPPTRAADGTWVPFIATDGTQFYDNCVDDVNNGAVCSLLHEYRVTTSADATV